jgi:hypothetical protein
LIPLANGRSSVGCVALAQFLDAPEAEREAKLRTCISDANRQRRRYQTDFMERAGRLFGLAAQSPILACSIET